MTGAEVLADLACAIADGAEVISDFRVMGDQEELFGLVASVPAAWRTLAEIAAGGERALGKVTAAVNAARRRAWAAAVTRHGALPGIRVADKMLAGLTCIRLDASVVTCHSDKEGAEPNFKGFGLHPLLAYCDTAAEPLAGILRPGSAGPWQPGTGTAGGLPGLFVHDRFAGAGLRLPSDRAVAGPLARPARARHAGGG